jgi:60 kDa SS-A/Ro ribonucleoprotein
MGYFTKVASVMAVALMKKAGGEGSLVAFGGTARLVPFSMRDSILTQAERLVSLEIQATNHSAGLELLSERGERADNLVLITDGEHNTGRPFAEGLNAYRRQVAPDCRVFVVDVSDGRHAVAPQGAPNVHYVYGWSDRVLAYIALASQGWGSIADAVRAGALGADAALAEVYSGDVIA